VVGGRQSVAIVEATLCMCSSEKKEYINNCCCHPICIDDMRNAHDTRENEASLKGKGWGGRRTIHATSSV
jgi:hypothetical protein